VALGIIALILLALFAIQQFGGMPGSGTPHSAEAAQARIEKLERLVATRQAVAELYGDVAGTFVQRFALVEPYIPDQKPSPAGIERLIRHRLEELGPLLNLTVAAGSRQTVGEGLSEFLADIAFTARNDAQALDAAAMFSRPETGLAWDSLVVTADRHERKVTFTGKLAVLAVEPVE